MAELELSRDQRLMLRAQAHHLRPTVLIGAAGLTAAVLQEIDRALAAHALIKVSMPVDDRDERNRWFTQVAETLGAARVQMIGKQTVFFRPVPESVDHGDDGDFAMNLTSARRRPRVRRS